MWWVVGQIWLNSDSNELSQSWVRLVNLGFELSRSWVRLANLGFELSRSWVTWIVIWVGVESVRKNESSTTLVVILCYGFFGSHFAFLSEVHGWWCDHQCFCILSFQIFFRESRENANWSIASWVGRGTFVLKNGFDIVFFFKSFGYIPRFSDLLKSWDSRFAIKML